MSMKKKLLATVLGGLAIAGFVAATVFAFPSLTSAQAATPATKTPVAGTRGRGGPAVDQAKGPAVGQDKYLADALGITQDVLKAAQTKAHEAAIQQAVKAGVITQEQADTMANKTEGQRGARVDLRGAKIDEQALLADALGISAEKLQAARETANKAELAQAVTDGRITQEQADQQTAERALAKYISDKGLYKSAVQSAVTDKVLTQAQADAILAKGQPGAFDFGMGPGGPGGGRGGHGGPGPAQGAPAQQGATQP